MNHTTLDHPSQPERALPAPGTLDPPNVVVPVYALADPQSLAVARAMRDRWDAWTLYDLTSRSDFRSRRHRRLLERVAFFWYGSHGRDHLDTADLVDELMRVNSPLAPLAVRLSRLPGWLLDAAGPAEALASVVKYGPRAFRLPRLDDRRSAAA